MDSLNFPFISEYVYVALFLNNILNAHRFFFLPSITYILVSHSMVFDENHLLILIQITTPLHVTLLLAFCLWCIWAWIYLIHWDSWMEVYVFANVGNVLVLKMFFLTQALLVNKGHKHLTLKVLMYPISLKLCSFFVFLNPFFSVVQGTFIPLCSVFYFSA